MSRHNFSKTTTFLLHFINNNSFSANNLISLIFRIASSICFKKKYNILRNTNVRLKLERSILNNNPQLKGICLDINKIKPRKPNSALRPVAKVKLYKLNKTILAHIPGEGHNLAIYSIVLVQGGNLKDVPNVKAKIIRGVLDCKSVINRRNGKSKYGSKNIFKIK